MKKTKIEWSLAERFIFIKENKYFNKEEVNKKELKKFLTLYLNKNIKSNKRLLTLAELIKDNSDTTDTLIDIATKIIADLK